MTKHFWGGRGTYHPRLQEPFPWCAFGLRVDSTVTSIILIGFFYVASDYP